jgi:hypothetical protein
LAETASAKLCIKSLISHDIAAHNRAVPFPLHISLVRSKLTKKYLPEVFIRGDKFYRRGRDPAKATRTEDTLMFTVVRSYFGKGAKELFDVLEKNKADVEKTIRSVKGFVSYSLVRSEDGGFSVTVCNDKAGCDESVEKARDWIAKNAAGIGVAAPKVSEGSNVFDLK